MTRRPLLCTVALITVACARPERPAPVAIPQASTGTPDSFGTGVVAASQSGVTLRLTAPAYAAVVRVFPRQRAELAYSGYSRLLPGTRRLRLPVERTPVWVATPPTSQLRSRRYEDPATNADAACLMQQARLAAGAAVPYDSGSPRAVSPPRVGLLCMPRADIRPDNPRPGHWEWADPIPLDEHYLVVIAADSPFDPTVLAELLGELDISLVSGEAAALVVPGYLLGEDVSWGAWVVHQP